MFLNCNYPDKYSVPKGRPKEVNPRTIDYSISKNKVTMYVLKNKHVYFKESNNAFYFGIDMNKAIIYNRFMIASFETICKINIALLDWGGTEFQLKSAEEDLIRMYLKLIQ